MFIKLTFLLPMVVLSLAHPVDHIDLARDGKAGKGDEIVRQMIPIPIDPAMILARNGSTDGGKLVDLNLEVNLGGLLSNILHLISALLGGILKKGEPIDPAMMLVRNGGSGGGLVNLDLGVDLSGLNGLLSNILCLLSGLLGSILKKGQPIDPAMMLARKDVSGGELVDLDLNVDLSSLSCLLGNILCLVSGLLGNILKTHPIDQDVLMRGGLSSNSLRSDKVPLVDLSVLATLEGLLYSTIDAEVAGENGLLDVNIVAILDHLLSLVVSINVKGHPVNLAAAELGRKLFAGIAEKNVAKAE